MLSLSLKIVSTPCILCSLAESPSPPSAGSMLWQDQPLVWAGSALAWGSAPEASSIGWGGDAVAWAADPLFWSG